MKPIETQNTEDPSDENNLTSCEKIRKSKQNKQSKRSKQGKLGKRNKGKSLLTLKEMSEDERRLHLNTEILRTIPDNIADVLAKTRSKPIWCSDIRWRMELGRRKSRYWF